MKLRIVSTFLWFFAGLILTDAFAYALGVTQLVGVLVGAAWAAFVNIDPKHLIWGVESRGHAAAKQRATLTSPQG